MAPLPGAARDCEIMKKCLEKYQIKEQDVVDLSNNPTADQTGRALDELSKRIRQGKQSEPPENYLVVLLFAGHGILRDGEQTLLYNEFNQRTGWYKEFRAEAKLRTWAEIFPNLYIIGIFACCR